MPSEWDAGEFVALVRAKVGEGPARALLPALESITDKFRFARYHSMQALDLLRPHKGAPKDDPLVQAAEGMRLLFHQDAAERARFTEALFGAQAHAIAFAQCLHSTADYLAKVAYLGLDLAGRHSISLARHQMSLFKIKERIAAITELVGVHRSMSDYLDSPAFKYLAAFVNTEKHHELIDSRYSLSVSVGSVASSGLQIAAFSYGGPRGLENHPKKWAFDFFEKDFESLIAGTVSVGCSLTDRLRVI